DSRRGGPRPAAWRAVRGRRHRSTADQPSPRAPRHDRRRSASGTSPRRAWPARRCTRRPSLYAAARVATLTPTTRAQERGISLLFLALDDRGLRIIDIPDPVGRRELARLLGPRIPQRGEG